MIFLILAISMIQPLHALSPPILKADATMQRLTTTYMAATAFLPLPVVGILVTQEKLGIAGPRDATNNGQGKRAHPYICLTSGSAFLALGAVYRCIVTYFPRTRLDSGWYTGAAYYYSSNILSVLFPIIFYGVTEVDQRFWLPKNYTGPEEKVKEFPRRELTDVYFSSLGDARSVDSVEFGLRG